MAAGDGREREVGRGNLERKAQERKDHTGLFSTGVSGSPRVYCAILLGRSKWSVFLGRRCGVV
jgi:hypothetical protein